MFCPNCGHDCGEYRFCSQCGTQIRDYTVTGAQNRVCQSEQIAEKQPEGKNAKIAAELPCGVYEGAMSSLALYEREFAVKNQVSLFKIIETTIPYNKLKTVIYVRGSAGFSHLLFRWEGNEKLPIPEVQRFKKDPTTVTVSQKADLLFYGGRNSEVMDINNDTLFYHIYYALKAIAPQTTVFRAEVQMQDMEKMKMLASKTDTNLYFAKYTPFRDQAVEEARQRTGAFQKIAREMINWIFDEQQERIYAEDPMAAVRDLNLIAAEKARLKEIAAEERRKENEQNRLVYALEDRD